MFRGNRIYKVDKNGNKKQVLFISGIRIVFKGSNSSVTIHEPFAKFKRCKISLGDNCNVEINSSKYVVRKLLLLANGKNTLIKIGKDFSVTSKCEVVMRPEPDLKLNIGNDCMFASNILIRPTDGHTIINTNTKEIMNYGQDIIIGNHVWIAYGATILKGVSIADNCVIGINSTVTKSCIETNAVYAGSPAKLVKRGIIWDRESPEAYNL